ncbi:hypothetical protein [Methylobacterium oxalidis]|uniref:hypothetical protein n=1 Tax=Methylobacterium oxalidis TaxID=944322 RepID=UPI0011BEB061|nr:hypothetical protein [Methylobacterium oxalidis]GJE34972.1 hypothetical protein LDDCCGHA_5187 [Methylobacterium oxalidis]
MANWFKQGLPSAGLFAGPTAWLISTQANYALSAWICGHRAQIIPLIAAPLILISLAGGLLSWRALNHPPAIERVAPTPDSLHHLASVDSRDAGRPHRLVGLISVSMALLFALAIAVHGTAGLVFDGCER